MAVCCPKETISIRSPRDPNTEIEKNQVLINHISYFILLKTTN